MPIFCSFLCKLLRSDKIPRFRIFLSFSLSVIEVGTASERISKETEKQFSFNCFLKLCEIQQSKDEQQPQQMMKIFFSVSQVYYVMRFMSVRVF